MNNDYKIKSAMAYYDIYWLFPSNYKSKLSSNVAFYLQPTFYHIQNIIDTLLSLNIFPKDIINLIGKQLLSDYNYPQETNDVEIILKRDYDINPDAYFVKFDTHDIQFEGFFDKFWNTIYLCRLYRPHPNYITLYEDIWYNLHKSFRLESISRTIDGSRCFRPLFLGKKKLNNK